MGGNAYEFIEWMDNWHVFSRSWNAVVYPTLSAAISDIASTRWRARSLGVYRLRFLGLVFGAIGICFLADRLGIGFAIQFVAWIAITSRIFVLIYMREKKT